MGDILTTPRAKLIERLARAGGTAPIPVRDRDAAVPLSPDQERLWLARQFNPGTASQHIANALRLEGELHRAALQRALEHLVERHESLRACVRSGPNGVVHDFVTSPVLPLRLEDLSTVAGVDQPRLVRQVLDEVTNAPFDLEAAPLWRAALIRLSPKEHVLVLTFHHLIADGWSCAVMLREWAQCYAAASSGERSDLAQEMAQFGDWVTAQRRKLQAGDCADDAAYWRDLLRDAPGAVHWPIKPPTAGAAQGADHVAISIERERFGQLQACARRQRVAVRAILLAALELVLARYTVKPGFLIATPVSGRSHPEVQNTIGFIANTLLYRSDQALPASASQLAARCNEQLLAAQDHQGLPFAHAATLYPADAADPFAVNVMFSLLPSADLPRFGSLTVSRIDLQAADIDFDVFLILEEQAQAIAGHLAFRPAAVGRATAEGLAHAFDDAVALLCRADDAAVASFALPASLQSDLAKRANADRRLLINGTFTVDSIAAGVRHAAAALNLSLKVETVGFNQVFQELLSPTSATRQNRSGLNVVLFRISDWLSKGCAPHDIAAAVRDVIHEFRTALSVGTAGATAQTIVIRAKEGVDTLVPLALQTECDAALGAACTENAGLHYVSPDDVDRYYPVADYADAVGEREASLPYTEQYCAALALMTVRRAYGLTKRPVKVIVVDCDNTLWRGVCAEDGVARLEIDAGRRALQELLLAQKRAGVLLCIASKNEPADVLQVFERRTDMPLKGEDFVALKVNWEPKSKNLRALSDELKLSLDSFVFIDDNAIEAAEVSAALPAVTVLQLPEDAPAMRRALDHFWALDRLKVTQEDARRTESYKQEVERAALRLGTASLRDFIAALRIEIDIQPARVADLERIAQLTLRTTQFNSTSITRTVPELQAFLAGAGNTCLSVRVSDRYGDYGLVGVAFLRREPSATILESLLLSCRALGRGVEHAMLAAVAARALPSGSTVVDIPVATTARNAPVRRFLASVPGGTITTDAAGNASSYRFSSAALAALAFAPDAEAMADRVAADEVAAAPASSGDAALLRQVLTDLHSPEQLLAAMRSASPRRAATKGVKPQTPLEERILSVWQPMLAAEHMGVTDNFFDMGGTSVMLVRLSSALQRALEREVSVITLFQYPTVRLLAGLLEGSATNRLDGVVSRGQSQRDVMRSRMRQRAAAPVAFVVNGAER